MQIGETYSWGADELGGVERDRLGARQERRGARENRVHQRGSSVFYGGGERRRRGHPRELQILRRVRTC